MWKMKSEKHRCIFLCFGFTSNVLCFCMSFVNPLQWWVLEVLGGDQEIYLSLSLCLNQRTKKMTVDGKTSLNGVVFWKSMGRLVSVDLKWGLMSLPWHFWNVMLTFQVYRTQINDLEHLGELGFGTCGHVVKMLHKPSKAVIAVKVCMAWTVFSL